MSQVDEVKQKTDIVGVIGSRVELKRAGKYFKGLCPFHGEKSPSFFVSPELQIYKCFGCGEGGDVFSFVQKYEGLEFREVLVDLAEKAGVELEAYQPTRAEEQTDKIREVLHLAEEYYQFLLMKHGAGGMGREYLKSRKVPQRLAEIFGMGWAPDSWDGLIRFLVGKKKYGIEVLEQAGLVVKKQQGGGFYDRFRGRIMFPLRDFRGRVVGFSGRLLVGEMDKAGPTDSIQAKYINTPETSVYRKRELLFGVDLTRPDIRKKDRAIVVEGEFDVISSYGAGVRNVVAIKGSALTEEQIKLLMRLTKNVVLCLDADAAGDMAMRKGIATAVNLGMDVEVIKIRGGKDVDELSRSKPEEWKRLAQERISIYQFLIESVFDKYDSDSGAGKRKISDEVMPVVAGISNKVEQAHYLREVARRLRVGVEVVEVELEKFGRKQSLAGSGNRVKTISEEVRSDRQDLLERYVWGRWLGLEGDDFLRVFEALRNIGWSHPGRDRLFGLVEEVVVKEGKFNLKKWVGGLPAELQGLVEQLYVSDQVVESKKVDEVVIELERVAVELEQLTIRRRLRGLAKEIGLLENQAETDPQAEQKLQMKQAEFAELTARVNS